MNTTLYCNKCGTPNSAEARFCSRCGGALNALSAAPDSSAAGAAAAPVSAGPYIPASAAGVGYGGFWIRVIAFIVDGIIVRAATWPVSMIFGLAGPGGMRGGLPHVTLGLHLFGGGVVVMFVIFGSWLYEAFMLSSPYQATLGKMIFGMKVTDIDDDRISFARASGRHFAKWLSGMILGIGYIMVAFTERKQGLHDMLATTLVRR
jgi:uncharacterized RDD family membrane protein YckC